MKKFTIISLLLQLSLGVVVEATPSPSFTFESKTEKITLKPGEDTAFISFPFENQSGETIEIDRQSSSCSCIAAEFKDGKTSYAPGEKGEVFAVFQVGNLHGSVTKNIVIWQKGDKANQPSIVLTANIEILELVSIAPKSVSWKAGEENLPKTYTLTVHEDSEVRVTQVTTTNNHFTPELRTIAEGKTYEITVTPKGTEESGMAIIKITTDSEAPRYRRIQSFASVLP